MKRLDVDFNKHELSIIKNDYVSIYDFSISNTHYGSIKFINTQGILAVIGDYGNWIFCREFHPSSTGFVSDSYWCEKLQINSTQEPYEFDYENTKKEIRARLESNDCDDDEVKKYLENLLEHVDDGENIYISYAWDNLPSCLDSILIIKKINPRLLIIFDAFDEICRRLKDKEI